MPLITSPSNAAVKAARKLVRSRARDRAAAFLVEGPQAAAEAVDCMTQLFVTDEAMARNADLVAAVRRAGAQVLVVASDVLDSLASTTSPQGLVGVAHLESPSLDFILEAALEGTGLLVVCHQVRDPGNVGTIIRTADAAGADAVLMTRGSVDPRNPKVVRASAGSLFHLPVVDGPTWKDVVGACRARGVAIVATDARGSAPLWTADLSGRIALVFGNEAHGLEATVMDDCDMVLQVPMRRAVRLGYSGTAESLNLAASAAVVVYEAVRQRAAAAGREVR